MTSPSEEEFQEWLGQPVTQWVLKYFKDFKKEAKEFWADSFASGQIFTLDEATVAIEVGKVQMIEQMEELSHETIVAFYETDEEETVEDTKH